MVERCPSVAIDTEFRDFLAVSGFNFSEEQRYSTQILNFNLLRIIQIGITFGDCARNLCFPCCLWQFNFWFSQSENLNNSDAVRLLENANIDFSKFESNRIDVVDFAPLLLASGLVMNEEIVWISFHGSSDFASSS
jgi:CCR4-NOT transcription complex subunit 7/8